MKKLSDDPSCFAASLKEATKHRFSPHSQFRKYTKAKMIFKRKKRKKVRLMLAEEIAKRNDGIRRSIPI